MTLEEFELFSTKHKRELLSELEIVEYTVNITRDDKKLQYSGVAFLPFLSLQWDLECLFVGRHRAEKILDYAYTIRSRGVGPLQVNCNRLGAGADIPVLAEKPSAVRKAVSKPGTKGLKRIK